MSRINQRPRFADAIFSLVPAAQLKIEGGVYEGLSWFDERTKPTEAEIDTKLAEMIAEYTAQEYARNRASATGYPSIPDQLDEIYHNGIDSWKAVIKVTKDKYPKG